MQQLTMMKTLLTLLGRKTQLVVNPDGNIQLGSNTEPAKIFNSPYFTLGLIGLVGLILWSNRPK